MPSIEKVDFGGLSTIKLQAGDSVVSIIPEYGGMINAWTFGNEELCDNYKTSDELKEYWDKSYKGMQLWPYPNRIENGRYTFGGKEYQLDLNFVYEDHSIHGFMGKLPMKSISHEITDAEAMITLQAEYHGDFNGYPFSAAISVSYSLSTANELNIISKIENKGKLEMPFGHGWHFYFKAGLPVDELVLQMEGSQKLLLDAHNIPTGRLVHDDTFVNGSSLNELSLDTCYVLQKGDTILSNPHSSLQIKLEQKVEDYPYLQLFTPEDRKSIAIEPMSCEPNAFNSGRGLVILKPGEVKELTCKLSASKNMT